MADADVNSAVEDSVWGAVWGGAFFNSGQVCAPVSRFYIHESLYDEFSEKFVAASKQVRYGDPMDMGTAIGPLAYKAHQDKVEEYMKKAEKEGVRTSRQWCLRNIR